eukprot:227433-Hanusia_phi.AAC.1
MRRRRAAAADSGEGAQVQSTVHLLLNVAHPSRLEPPRSTQLLGGEGGAMARQASSRMHVMRMRMRIIGERSRREYWHMVERAGWVLSKERERDGEGEKPSQGRAEE